MGRIAIWIGWAITALGACAAAQSDSGDVPDMRETIVQLREREGWERLEAVQSLEQRGLALVEGEHAQVSAEEAYQILDDAQDYIRGILDASRMELGPVPEIPPKDPLRENPGPYDHLGTFREVARHLGYDISRCWREGEHDAALDRAAAIVRMGNALIQSGHALHAMTGGALWQIATDRLEALAAACEADPRLSDAFSREAFDELHSVVEARPAIDPQGIRRWTVSDMRRRTSWLREQFTGEGGAERYRAYLQEHWQTEGQLRRRGALTTALIYEDRFELLLREDPTKRELGMVKFWALLSDEERAEAIAAYQRWLEKIGFSPLDTIPRLIPGVEQVPREDVIRKILDDIEALASKLDAASSRKEIEEAFTLLALAVERDRSQLTRIASAGGSGSHVVWQLSLQRYDEAIAAAERLARSTRQDP